MISRKPRTQHTNITSLLETWASFVLLCTLFTLPNCNTLPIHHFPSDLNTHRSPILQIRWWWKVHSIWLLGSGLTTVLCNPSFFLWLVMISPQPCFFCWYILAPSQQPSLRTGFRERGFQKKTWWFSEWGIHVTKEIHLHCDADHQIMIHLASHGQEDKSSSFSVTLPTPILTCNGDFFISSCKELPRDHGLLKLPVPGMLLLEILTPFILNNTNLSPPSPASFVALAAISASDC